MRLLDEIIDYAVDNKEPVSVLLRKCLVLAYQLKNDRLKNWIEKELDGYNVDDELPKYRLVRAQAKGTLFGPFNSIINEQPIPSLILKQEHRHFAETVKLTQPIAAYDIDRKEDQSSKYVIEWPANLTLFYQGKIIDAYALNRAWQEIPRSAFVSLIDTIRNRVLHFALELRDDLGLVSDDLASLPQGKVDQYVNNYIFGGNNVISGTTHDFTQIGSIVITKNDMQALTDALKN